MTFRDGLFEFLSRMTRRDFAPKFHLQLSF